MINELPEYDCQISKQNAYSIVSGVVALVFCLHIKKPNFGMTTGHNRIRVLFVSVILDHSPIPFISFYTRYLGNIPVHFRITS